MASSATTPSPDLLAQQLASAHVPHWVPAVAYSRGNAVEMVHSGGAVAVDASGKVLFELDDTGSSHTFMRSAVKLWQALPLVRSGAADRFGFSDQELALAVSSHNGEVAHTATAQSMLDKLGLPSSALLCGLHVPYDEQAAIACAGKPSVVMNNCSGKHCGMLAACIHNQWPLESYQKYDHPLQVAIRAEICRAAGLPDETHLSQHGVDGCGVPTYSMPLRSMARMYATIGHSEGADAEQRLLSCMRTHPDMIAGQREFDTRISRVTGGRVLSKRGGAALGCAKVGQDVGIVVKCGNGDMRTVPVLMTRVLEQLALLNERERAAVEDLARPDLLNCSGVVIGKAFPIF